MMMTAELAFAGNGACGRELSLEEIEAVSGGLTNRQFADDLSVAAAGMSLAAAASALGASPVSGSRAVGALGATFCATAINFMFSMGWSDLDEQLGASFYARLQAGMNWMAAH